MINNKLFRGFTFDGVNSLDYDIYITGEGVYNAPERAVEKVSVPGRNGDLTIDQGRFENLEVTYAQCGCAAKTQAELAEKVAAFRNALCSRVGYKRLTDDYNKDEYRMAMYVSGLEVEAIAQHRMGTFDIVFDAKPQRFLYTGETPRLLVQGMTPKNPQTESGAIVSVESDGADKVTSLAAQIEPMQSGSGDPSPTNVRPITGHTSTNVTVAGKNLIGFKSLLDNWGSGYTDLGDSYNVTTTGTGYREPFRFASKDIDVTLSGEITQLSGAAGWRFQLLNSSDEVVAMLGSGSTTLSGKGCKLRLNYSTVGEGANFKNIQVELGTTATAYEPYKGTTTTTALGRTVYGGTVDVVTGTLTLTHKSETFNGTESWGSEQTSVGLTNYYLNLDVAGKMAGRQGGLLDDELLCNWLAPSSSITTYGVYVGATSKFLNCKCQSASDVTSFKSMLSATPLVVVYPLATPQTYQLTAQQVELLTGQNHVWADTGNITLTYGADPYKVVNPTLFESKPLLQVTGRGTLSVGDVTMTITGTASQVLYIDCDIMEVYSITDGQMQPQNSLVTMNSYDFPKLKPGANKITLGVGITQVVVTPRWWRV